MERGDIHLSRLWVYYIFHLAEFSLEPTRGPRKNESIAFTIWNRVEYLFETSIHQSKHSASWSLLTKADRIFSSMQIFLTFWSNSFRSKSSGKFKIYVGKLRRFFMTILILTWQAQDQCRISFLKIDCLMAASALCTLNIPDSIFLLRSWLPLQRCFWRPSWLQS